jgi:hypothetical protein
MSTYEHRYASFYDPFAEGNVVGPSEIFPDVKHLASVHIDAPPPYTAAKTVLKVISAEKSSASDSDGITYDADTKLNIHGQGTVVANCVSPIRLLFTFSTDDSSNPSLYVEVTENTINYWYGPTPPKGSSGFLPGDRVAIQGNLINISPTATTAPTYLHAHDYPARYWLSVDHKNGLLRFGRDYTNYALALYEAKLKKLVPPGVWHWSDDKVQIYLFLNSHIADLIV